MEDMKFLHKRMRREKKEKLNACRYRVIWNLLESRENA